MLRHRIGLANNDVIVPPIEPFAGIAALHSSDLRSKIVRLIIGVFETRPNANPPANTLGLGYPLAAVVIHAPM